MVECTIGYIENYQGNFIHFWFYKEVQGEWHRIREVKVHKDSRVFYLKSIMKSAKIVPLGRGTECTT